MFSFSYASTEFVALFQKYDPRAELLDPAISAMKDTGLIDYMRRIRLPHMGMKEQIGVVKEKELETQHFYLPLMLLLAGFVSALLSCIYEKFIRKDKLLYDYDV